MCILPSFMFELVLKYACPWGFYEFEDAQSVSEDPRWEGKDGSYTWSLVQSDAWSDAYGWALDMQRGYLRILAFRG